MTLKSALCMCLAVACITATSAQTVKTTFQTSREWMPTMDNRADAVMIYGIGGNPHDDGRTDATFEQRADSWKEHGYQVHYMTGAAWGEYKDYLLGRWDGRRHYDEVQREENGKGIWHGYQIPYFVPTASYAQYIKENLRRVIDKGVSHIFLEEPEFWARGGYSEAFKREWLEFYGFPWKAQHLSPENTYLSNKLKYHLYYRMIEDVLGYAKEYGRSKGMDVKCYIPTHSLINYSQWNIVSPEASLASLPCVDGYIAQVWTNTAKEPRFYNGQCRQRVFETALIEYECMRSMTAPTSRKVFFLTDPVEDKARDWDEYRDNYQATFTAQLMYPDIDSYEIMPWPERIYHGRYRTSADDGKMEGIPAGYATQMQVMINTLNNMPISENSISGSKGISVLMSNSLMFQRFPTHEGYEDPFLANFMGQVTPLYKRGVPVSVVHMENLGYEQALGGTEILLMTYSNMKPLDAQAHKILANWVKAGGMIVYSGRDTDPFQKVQEWWNSGDDKFSCPSGHLFSLMGLEADPGEGMHQVGKGKICIIRKDPKEYVMTEGGHKGYIAAIEQLYATRHEEGLCDRNHFILERGPYTLAAVLDECSCDEDLTLEGMYVNLFSSHLEVLSSPVVKTGTQAMFVNLARIDSSKPSVIASATRISDEKTKGRYYAFVAQGPQNIHNVTRVLLPSRPSDIHIDSKRMTKEEIDAAWHEESHTILLEFPSSHEGTQVTIKF